MHDHKQVEVLWPFSKPERFIEVDEGMAELLTEIWKSGIYTVLSCQENRPGIAWIMFPSAEEASKFLNIVAKYPTGKKPWLSLYGRIGQACENWNNNWEYTAHPCNYSEIETINEKEDSVETEYLGYNDFDFEISVRFPVKDIPILIRRLKAHNA